MRREEEIKKERDKKEREDIWKSKECQELYKKLIDYAGDFLVLGKISVIKPRIWPFLLFRRTRN